ncbi:cytochrome c-550 PedF [Salinisphaera sp. T31B1]|uniref:cytochrome c-550 PedF n=1 Tax=Salinisphaera sp. T31B1 TaxID=727963 RepID=UPI00333E66A8
MTQFLNAAAVAMVAGLFWLSGPALAQHGGGEGDVDHSALPDIPDGQWLDSNPYRGSKKAMEIGKAAYDGNCARCHGIDMISGGIAPDLRELGPEYDEYFLGHIRNGVQRNGMTYMPAFEGVLDQKTMWAIRSYIDQRHYEYKDKDLDALYKQWDDKHGDDSSADQAPDDHSAKASEAGPSTASATARSVRVARSGDDMPDRLQAIQRNGSIEIAVYRAFPPWSYQPDSGAFTGIDVDIGQALAEQLGVKLNVRAFTPDETMGDDIRNQVWKGHYLGGGTADAMLHVGMAPAFQADNDQATFLAPYYDETMGFAYDAERLGEDVDSPLALAGKKVGVQLDSLGDYFLTSAYQGRLRDDVEHFDSVPDAMRALNSGEVAAVMAPVGELSGAARMLDEQRVKIRTTPLSGMYQTSWDVGVAIKAGNPELAGAIRQAMQTLRDQGKIEAIFKQYGVPYRAPTAESSATTGA